LRPSDVFFGRRDIILNERVEKIKTARQKRIEINKNALQ
jgi:hypothetical protein